ncbi:MAG: winged helix-turn-helix transcriptional regulator, partial [Paracoccaceae bacterium]
MQGTDATPDKIDTAALRGSNQSGMRDHNERLVLSLVRQHGALAKSDIARMTGLSAQTVSVIMRALERDGLLLRGEPQRGRIGQPSVPMSLNHEGAFFLGLKIGRRSADLVLVDFLGQLRGTHRRVYR